MRTVVQVTSRRVQTSSSSCMQLRNQERRHRQFQDEACFQVLQLAFKGECGAERLTECELLYKLRCHIQRLQQQVVKQQQQLSSGANPLDTNKKVGKGKKKINSKVHQDFVNSLEEIMDAPNAEIKVTASTGSIPQPPTLEVRSSVPVTQASLLATKSSSQPVATTTKYTLHKVVPETNPTQTVVSQTKSTLQPVATETKSTPQKVVTETKSTPQKVVTETKSTPQKVVTETKSTPQKVVTETKYTPQKVVTKTNPTQTVVSHTKSTPQKVVPETKSTPQKVVPETNPTQTVVSQTKSAQKVVPETNPTQTVVSQTKSTQKVVPETNPTQTVVSRTKSTPQKVVPETNPTQAVVSRTKFTLQPVVTERKSAPQKVVSQTTCTPQSGVVETSPPKMNTLTEVAPQRIFTETKSTSQITITRTKNKTTSNIATEQINLPAISNPQLVTTKTKTSSQPVISGTQNKPTSHIEQIYLSVTEHNPQLTISKTKSSPKPVVEEMKPTSHDPTTSSQTTILTTTNTKKSPTILVKKFYSPTFNSTYARKSPSILSKSKLNTPPKTLLPTKTSPVSNSQTEILSDISNNLHTPEVSPTVPGPTSLLTNSYKPKYSPDKPLNEASIPTTPEQARKPCVSEVIDLTKDPNEEETTDDNKTRGISGNTKSSFDNSMLVVYRQASNQVTTYEKKYTFPTSPVVTNNEPKLSITHTPIINHTHHQPILPNPGIHGQIIRVIPFQTTENVKFEKVYYNTTDIITKDPNSSTTNLLSRILTPTKTELYEITTGYNTDIIDLSTKSKNLPVNAMRKIFKSNSRPCIKYNSVKLLDYTPACKTVLAGRKRKLSEDSYKNEKELKLISDVLPDDAIITDDDDDYQCMFNEDIAYYTRLDKMLLSLTDEEIEEDALWQEDEMDELLAFYNLDPCPFNNETPPLVELLGDDLTFPELYDNNMLSDIFQDIKLLEDLDVDLDAINSARELTQL